MLFKYSPVILYNQNFRQREDSYDIATDIFFRTKFREIIKNENIAYYLYTIPDGETPDILARKYYGSPTDYWIIFYANDIINPFYDWPLEYKDFQRFIIEKYGSIASAQTTIHHYEKLVTTTDSRTGETVTRRYEIDQDDARTNIGETLPLDDFTSLAVDSYPNVSGNFSDGSSVEIVISRNSVTNYDWELDNNEKKREIKVIRKDYYGSIIREMENYLFEAKKVPYIRDIRGY